MIEENRNKDQVVIGKITELTQNHVTVHTLEWGFVTIKRSENWDCGVSWAGFIEHLKIGDKVDILRKYNQQKLLYGFYTLGSLLSSPARDSQAVAQNEKMMNFVEKQEQEAVVIDYWYFENKDTYYDDRLATHIKCWNPVWKEIAFDTYSHIPLRYNDVIVIAKRHYMKFGEYHVIENKTLTQERQRIINDVLLRDFNDAERQKILLYPKSKQK